MIDAILGRSFVLALAMSLLAGCFSGPGRDIVIEESPRGAVYLERIPSHRGRASYPRSISPTVLAQFLRGVQIQGQQRLLQSLLAGMPTPTRAFSEEQVEFLLPHLTQAFSMAASDQQISFRVVSPLSSEAGELRATLLADKDMLYLIITQWRRLQRDSTSFESWSLSFVPASAWNQDPQSHPDFLDSFSRPWLAVYYQMLARTSENPVQSKPTPAKPSDRRGNGSPATRTTGEDEERLEQVRDEIRTLLQRLQELEAEFKDLQEKDGTTRKHP